MASSTPSVPITSSRGAPDTTVGRIYFSTPSAQVPVPVGDLVSPSLPPTYAQTIVLGGKIFRGWRKSYPTAYILSGGGIIIRAGAGGQKVWQKKSENCRTVPKIPYSISLYIEPNYTLSLYIEPNYTLSLYIEPHYTLS